MLNGYVISDIHFGASSNKDLYSMLNKVFLKKIKNTDRLDMVVIAGDLLDRKLSFNSEASKLCIQFIENLSILSRKKEFAIRIIKGTKNHDLDQLNNFLYLEKRAKLDFKIINVVTEEIYKDYKILYVPEEYMEDPKEYYKDYFDKRNSYDICFLHGTFNHVEFTSKMINSEKPISTAPIFSYNEFKNFVKGPVICGHVHETSSYKKKIYYTGSFTRWKFGEEKKKGFMSFTLEDDSKDYTVKFIENKYAPRYDTIDITDIDNIDSTDSLEKKIQEIQKYKKDNNIAHLRINVHKDIYDKIDSNIMKKYFSEEEDDIKISLSKNQIKREKEEDDELESTYAFIFENKYGTDIPGMSRTIAEYNKIHDNISINVDVVENILTIDE